jgi:hypothetical protein
MKRQFKRDRERHKLRKTIKRDKLSRKKNRLIMKSMYT